MSFSQTTISEELAKIESLLEQSQYKEVLSRLSNLRSSYVDKTDVLEIARIYHLHAKALYLTGQNRPALLKAKAALRLMRLENDFSLYADIKLLLGLILMTLGRVAEAGEAFNESYVFYKRTGDTKSLLFPLNNLARLHFVSGNLILAREVLERCVRIATQYHSEKRVNIDKRNLARVLLFMGDLKGSEAILRAIRNCDPEVSGRANTCQMLGVLSILRFNYSDASNDLMEALGLFEDLNLRPGAAVCVEYLGLLEYTRGNYAKAREYYQKVLEMPEPTASAVAQTMRMLTDVYIAEGKFDLAEETAVKAEAAITRINERIELGALYRAYGQIYTSKKETETARDYFQKSIDLLRDIGARYELALSYKAAGESESYTIDERRRHLEMSRMLFIEMNVPKRVEQVETAIGKLQVYSVVDDGLRTANVAAPTIITGNRQMKQILATVERIKETTHTVLITGETGTGKDLLAEYIHRSSVRADKPFRIVNAAAIPSDLLESELFGYRKGTYTGANQDKVGLIESAEGGTFYFDEIGEAPLDAQTKLLRVLDTKSVRRLGTTSDIKVDVRFIAATNIDLKQMMESGRFRRDLYYRLQEMPIHLPPLRDRLDDIGLLVEYFLRETGFENAGIDTCT
jgi:tetratricopeptide (TPR) repeat protein